MRALLLEQYVSLDSEPPAESWWAVGGGVDPGRRPTSQSAREPTTLTTPSYSFSSTIAHPVKRNQAVSSNNPIKPHFPSGRAHISLLMGAGLGAQLLTEHCCEVVSSRLIYQEVPALPALPLICQPPSWQELLLSCLHRARAHLLAERQNIP